MISAVDSSVRLAQPNQPATSSSPDAHLLEARAAREAAEVAGRERVHVDLVLERVLALLDRVVVGEAPPRADDPPPGRRDGQRGALRPRGHAVAVTRRLARERQHPAGLQHAAELAEGGVQVGQVVQHGVAEDEVERVVGEQQALGLGARRLHAAAQPESSADADSVSSMPCEMSVATALSTTPAAAG